MNHQIHASELIHCQKCEPDYNHPDYSSGHIYCETSIILLGWLASLYPIIQSLLFTTVENFYFFLPNMQNPVSHNMVRGKHVYLRFVTSRLSYWSLFLKNVHSRIYHVLHTQSPKVSHSQQITNFSQVLFSEWYGHNCCGVRVTLSDLKWSQNITHKVRKCNYTICLLDLPLEDGTFVCDEVFFRDCCFLDEMAICFAFLRQQGLHFNSS